MQVHTPRQRTTRRTQHHLSRTVRQVMHHHTTRPEIQEATPHQPIILHTRHRPTTPRAVDTRTPRRLDTITQHQATEHRAEVSHILTQHPGPAILIQHRDQDMRIPHQAVNILIRRLEPIRTQRLDRDMHIQARRIRIQRRVLDTAIPLRPMDRQVTVHHLTVHHLVGDTRTQRQVEEHMGLQLMALHHMGLQRMVLRPMARRVMGRQNTTRPHTGPQNTVRRAMTRHHMEPQATTPRATAHRPIPLHQKFMVHKHRAVGYGHFLKRSLESN